MTDKLPPQLLALFQPRPPVRYLIPPGDSPEERGTKQSTLGGLAAFLPQIDDYKENDVYHPTESWSQARDRKRAEKQQRKEEMQSDDFDGFKPDEDPKVKGDALKTLFVGRLSYEVKESDLEREFGRFGPVERIRIVKDETTSKPKKPHRGYAFIVYERERDMKAAYKETDGLRIKDRKVVVDVERGRMVPGWRPRRFGGGLGGRGYTRQAPARPNFAQGPGAFQSQGFGGNSFGGRGGGFRGGGFRGDRGGGGDRGGFGGRGGRGGVGFQDRGGFGDRRGGYGGGPPQGAPSGPGGRGGFGGSNGYEDRRNGYDRGSGGGGGGYGGRDRGGQTGGNREPLGGRDRGYDDRDRGDRADRGYGGGSSGGRRDDDYGSRKRHHENDGYDDPRKRRY